jgi:hypothetical protein
MARVYTLHRPSQKLEARCPMCSATYVYNEGTVKGAEVDLPPHERAKGPKQACPGSGFTVKLRYQARPLNAAPEPENVPKDSDPFPFGIYKGASKTYGEVPAAYYDWMVGQPWSKRWPQVLAYIRANQKAIDKDLQ